MEGEFVIANRGRSEGIPFPWAVARADGADDVSVPMYLDECIFLSFGSAKDTRVEETDLVFLSGDSMERQFGFECTWEGVHTVRRTQKADAVTGVSVRCPVEDGGIENTSDRAGALPVGCRLSEAEISACGTCLESCVEECRLAHVTP